MTKTPAIESSEVDESKAPLMEHLIELRARLMKSVFALVAGAVICIPFLRQILDALVWPFALAVERFNVKMEARGLPLMDLDIIATHPLETFFVKLKLALFGGVLLAFPVIAYQLYRFVAPGLYKNEKGAFLPYLILSPILFLLGAALVFFFVFPYVMEFALSQQQGLSGGGEIALLTKISDYLKLAMTLFLAFGLSFQLPVILSLLGRAGIIGSAALKKGRRYAVVGIAAFAAFVTPPDPITQIVLGSAIYLLYEISIICVRIVEQKDQDAPVETKASA
jgi:sec-independent protein translocase protein TatC